MPCSTPKTGIKEVRNILAGTFPGKHVDALLKYFLEGAKKYRSGDWEGVIYEVASNRGGRHDADDIDANKMDVKAVIPLMSWVVAEMVRFSNSGAINPEDISALVESLSEKIYPSFEEIDGRPYVNLDRLSALEIGLLLLYFKYPHRIGRQELVGAIKRHGPKRNASEVAAHRLKSLVDDDNGAWKLRGLGRQKAEVFLNGRTTK